MPPNGMLFFFTTSWPDRLKHDYIPSDQVVIEQTVQWIKSVVIGCNFCPFAAPALKSDAIRYVVVPILSRRQTLDQLLKEMEFLDLNPSVETTFLIYPASLRGFGDYLNFVSKAELLNTAKHYNGIYQIASFHPDYAFAGSTGDDPADYTNRSPYPMLHLLREASVTRVLAHFPDPAGIPQRNIAYARQKGYRYMKWLRNSCM